MSDPCDWVWVVGRHLIGAAEIPDSAAGDVNILDVRWRLGGPSAADDYLAGHIPGAVFVDLDELCGPPGPGGRHPLPTREALERVLRLAGVRADRPVVVYDYGDGMAAARAWWTLRWAGHSDVRVLEGGFAAWDGPVETGSDFVVRPGGMPVLTAAEAARVAREGVLLDARAAERFRGETEPIDPVAGHIPGARNLPYAELVARGAEALPLEAGQIGVYCGSGITAAHTVLALHEAGREDAALYVGSWSEWIVDPDHPIATGA